MNKFIVKQLRVLDFALNRQFMWACRPGSANLLYSYYLGGL